MNKADADAPPALIDRHSTVQVYSLATWVPKVCLNPCFSVSNPRLRLAPGKLGSSYKAAETHA